MQHSSQWKWYRIVALVVVAGGFALVKPDVIGKWTDRMRGVANWFGLCAPPLTVSEYPEGYPCETREAESVAVDNRVGFGDHRYYLWSSEGARGFDVFDGESDVSDLSRFAAQVYNVHYSKMIVRGEPLEEFDLHVLDFCIQVHYAYLHAACCAIGEGVFGGDESLVGDHLGDTLNHCVKGFRWSKADVRRINALVGRWHAKELAETAREFGGLLGENDPGYLLKRLDEIGSDECHEIRKNDASLARYPFEKAEKSVYLWRELQAALVNGPLNALTKINRETQLTISRARDVDGHAGLRKLMEVWRPKLRTLARGYAYLTSDLPIVVIAHAAYAVTDEADGFFHTDREAVKRAAFQYVRATGDGMFLKYMRSHYAADISLQYHRYVKKLLGSREYAAFQTSLKLAKENELDFKSEDWFGEETGARRSRSNDFESAIERE